MFATLSSIPPRFSLAYIVLSISIIFYAVFWIWGMIHAAATPKATAAQKSFWVLSILINPSAAVWYWYVWKRWAFWILFTPILGAFLSLPLVVRSLLTHATASYVTNTLFALGTMPILVLAATLMVYPLLLRLAVLLHLGRNKDLDAMGRNDWVCTIAVPLFGFGAALAYCAKNRRAWAIVSLFWLLSISASFRLILANTAQALFTTGEVKREQLMLRPPPPANPLP